MPINVFMSVVTLGRIVEGRPLKRDSFCSLNRSIYSIMIFPNGCPLSLEMMLQSKCFNIAHVRVVTYIKILFK